MSDDSTKREERAEAPETEGQASAAASGDAATAVPEGAAETEDAPETEDARLSSRFAAGQAADRFEREAADFHARVRDGFHRLAAEEPNRFRVVRTDGPVETAAEAIWRQIGLDTGSN